MINNPDNDDTGGNFLLELVGLLADEGSTDARTNYSERVKEIVGEAIVAKHSSSEEPT